MAYADSVLIAGDTALQGRVAASLFVQMHNVQTESLSSTLPLQLHVTRARQAAQILQAFANGTSANWITAFTRVVSVNGTCVTDATTQAGGSLTSGNEAAACAAITDAHIDNAISAAFNDFLALV